MKSHRTASSHRGENGRNHSKSIKRALVAGVATASLAIAGCAGDHKYNSDIEAQLKGVIKPTMVDIAKRAFALSLMYPKRFSTESAPDGRVHLSGVKQDLSTGKEGSDVMVDVLMGKSDGKPDPEQVETVELGVSKGNSAGLVTRAKHLSFSAPGNDIGNANTDGWIASGGGGEVNADGSPKTSFEMDSSNTGGAHAPVPVAKQLSDMAPELFDEVQHSLAR